MDKLKIWTILDFGNFRGGPETGRKVLLEYFDIVTKKQFNKSVITSPDPLIIGAIALGYLIGESDYECFDLMPNLRVVALWDIGTERVDLSYFKRRNIRIATNVTVQDNACADMAMALLLSMGRDVLTGHMKAIHKDTLDHSAYADIPMSIEVTGASMGIVGMGGIGYQVARRAALGFSMKIYYHNRKQRSSEQAKAINATYCSSLHEMLPTCDFIVIACPLTDDTKNLMGEKEFKLMKSSAIIVNISRGQIIDQDALVKALKTGEIRGAGLDVTYPEPLPRDHPLLTLPNVIITPHFGSRTAETRLKMIVNVAEKLKVGLEGKPMEGEIYLNDIVCNR